MLMSGGSCTDDDEVPPILTLSPEYECDGGLGGADPICDCCDDEEDVED
jgi:hypothetical protein